MVISGDLLVTYSSKILLDGGFRLVDFALKAQVEAFYHVSRARIVMVDQYHFIVIPVRHFCKGVEVPLCSEDDDTGSSSR